MLRLTESGACVLELRLACEPVPDRLSRRWCLCAADIWRALFLALSGGGEARAEANCVPGVRGDWLLELPAGEEGLGLSMSVPDEETAAHYAAVWPGVRAGLAGQLREALATCLQP